MKNYCFEDIIFEILTWLPAKSLMRFNCVSKAWNSLIRYDPYFVKLHCVRSHARPSAINLLFELLESSYNKDVAVKENKKEWLKGFTSKQLANRHYFYDNEMMIICSNHCNGLVCLYNVKDTQVYLLNITTGEIEALSFSVNDVEFPLSPILYLGFDLVAEKYKLIQLFWEDNTHRVPKIRIRTLGTDSCWRNCWCKPTVLSDRCYFLNGVLYWVQFSKGAYMLSFDVRYEKFQRISLPKKYHHFILVNDMETALRGKLVMHLYTNELEQSYWIYDDVNKVFTKFFEYPTGFGEKMIAFSAPEKIDKSKQIRVLATSSIINASSTGNLIFPRGFLLMKVGCFVENIVPLSSLV